MTIIRELGVDDTAAFVELRRLSLRTDPESFAANPETDAGSNMELARERFRQATAIEGPFVVGAFEDTLIGIGGLRRTGPAAAAVWGFYVKPDCRGRGVARLLIDRLIEIARRMPEVVRLELGVSGTSAAAMRVYERAGFRMTGRRTAECAHVMELELT